jgi:hypothetical protein
MVLLASSYDKSRFFKAEDLEGEKKLRIKTVIGAFGDDCAGWAGKIVVLFPSTTGLAGKMVPSLRVPMPPPKQAAAGNGVTKPG